MQEWDAFKEGKEIIMVDQDPGTDPDVVMDLSKPWTSPVLVNHIVDSMGPLAARFVQTKAFYRSAWQALLPGGRMHVWVGLSTTAVLEKRTSGFQILKIDAPDPSRPLPRLTPLEMLHYVWLTKLTIPSSSKHLPEVKCVVSGDSKRLFTITCKGALAKKDPRARPTEYVWQVSDVDPKIVKSISMVSSCDHGDEMFEASKAVRDYNKKFSFEFPKQLYFDDISIPFAGEFNSFVTFQLETFAAVSVGKWTAAYTGDEEMVVEVLELPEEDAKSPSEATQQKMRGLADRMKVESSSTDDGFAPFK